jgi:hypothetical protein
VARHSFRDRQGLYTSVAAHSARLLAPRCRGRAAVS